MFNIGIPEIALILAIALIAIGPKKLPSAARSLGRGIRKTKQVVAEIMGIWDNEINKLDTETQKPHEKTTEPQAEPEQKPGQETKPEQKPEPEEKDDEDKNFPASDYFSSL